MHDVGDIIQQARTWRISEIWMPHIMVFMHCIINTYPESPSALQCHHYRRFFLLLQQVLPCPRCRRYYHNFLKDRPLNNHVMYGGKQSMRRWIHRLYIFLVQKGVLHPDAVGQSCEDVDLKILQDKLFGITEDKVWRYTRIWGPHAWVFLHSVANTFPVRPLYAQKQDYGQFFDSLVYVLPCNICREHYAQWLQKEPISLAIASREKLQAWISALHNYVNSFLEKPIFHDRNEGQKQILQYALNSQSL